MVVCCYIYPFVHTEARGGCQISHLSFSTLLPCDRIFHCAWNKTGSQPGIILSFLSLPLTKHWCYWYMQLYSHCSSIKEFNNSLEWNITKVYLFGNKLAVRVVNCMCWELEQNPRAKKEGSRAHFSSVLIILEITFNVGWNLKGYKLKKFPKHSLFCSICSGHLNSDFMLMQQTLLHTKSSP